MQRTVTSRLGAAAVAAVFVVTTGITAMEAHQLAAHAVAPEIATPVQPVALGRQADHDHDRGYEHGHHAPAPAPGGGDEHSGHAGHAGHGGRMDATGEPTGPTDVAADRGHSGHSGHSQHGSTSECTCVGPCATGAPPTLSDGTFAEISVGETASFREVAARARVVPQDPRTYLLPFPNAPPAGV